MYYYRDKKIIKAHFNRYFMRKSFASTRIWTHDLLTCVFVPSFLVFVYLRLITSLNVFCFLPKVLMILDFFDADIFDFIPSESKVNQMWFEIVLGYRLSITEWLASRKKQLLRLSLSSTKDRSVEGRTIIIRFHGLGAVVVGQSEDLVIKRWWVWILPGAAAFFSSLLFYKTFT